jgi:hypothetical protein
MAVQYAFGKIVTQGLDLNVDAADPTSYPGTGTTWTSVVNRSITGSLISCSFSSDFKGGIVFNNPSASVEFPGTVANYGTGSFTIEMAFRPSHIEGIHYLVSKNSGSYPNWGVYLSGSGGSGKLFAEYNINASVSCSVSSSTVFETGSNYFVDAVFSPLERRNYINVEGNYDAVSIISNGTGSLTTTGSLFIGNLTVSSSQAYSGSIFNTKIYSTFTSGFSNFKSISQRINKPIPARAASALALVVGGGGAGGRTLNPAQWENGAGGGGGGVITTTLNNLTPGAVYNLFVGDGSSTTQSGSNSFIGSTIAYGGGRGGDNAIRVGGDGASGGGGAGNTGAGFAGGLAIYNNQGFNGGSGGTSGTTAGAGGGGGAGQPGLNGGTGVGGKGGDGLLSFITGQLTYYGGGGGGNGRAAGTAGVGGLGGGGTGGTSTAPAVTATTGSPNTGGGGGGGSTLGQYVKGGSGIVIIRYPGPPIATGGTITSVDGDTIHTFTATGSSTFTIF